VTVTDEDLEAIAERGPRLTKQILDLVYSMDEVKTAAERAMLLVVAAHAVALAGGIPLDTVIDVVKAGAWAGEN
jgi:hypothetical protein